MVSLETTILLGACHFHQNPPPMLQTQREIFMEFQPTDRE
jgi:hypothetical protein